MKGSRLTTILPAPVPFDAHGVRPISRGSLGARFFCAAIALTVPLASALASPPGLARDRSNSPPVNEEPIVIYHNTPDQRRAELRRALISGAELPQAPAERRRLSPERRDVLNQELRAAVRDAYQQRGVPTR